VSIETTLARGAAREAETAWKIHRRDCVTCSRPRGDRCASGQKVWRVHAEAKAELARQRALDKAPIEGQEVLF